MSLKYVFKTIQQAYVNVSTVNKCAMSYAYGKTNGYTVNMHVNVSVTFVCSYHRQHIDNSFEILRVRYSYFGRIDI
jgi:hypothetical protein